MNWVWVLFIWGLNSPIANSGITTLTYATEEECQIARKIVRKINATKVNNPECRKMPREIGYIDLGKKIQILKKTEVIYENN